MKTKGATMSLAESLIAELKQEAETTRRVLERVPEDKMSWTPHPKSMTLGQLAMHIAQAPGGVAELISQPVAEAPKFPVPEAKSRTEILCALDESLETATRALSGWSDGDLAAEWTMTMNGQPIMAMPRIAMVRSILLNHTYHHRGQLTVYLRLLDVPIPSVYGPTADENPFA